MSEQYLPQARDYLSRFFSSRREEFREAARELRPHRGYGPYYKDTEVTQALIDIYHIVDDYFSDLRIPESFASPRMFVSILRGFRSKLKEYEALLKEVSTYYEEKDLTLPIPPRELYTSVEHILDALEHVLDMGEIKAVMGDITETKIIPGDPFHRLEVLLNSFHLVAVQMKDRRKDGKIPRETLTIGDEYDVQDLLHSLLKIDFNDIRDEEWTPSYAGSAARIDFLLKEEEYAIEVKMASDTLRDKVIGKQLIEDIAHYAPHPDCSHLICFVYDPEYKIKNPQGLVTDLSKMSTDELTVSVFIRPR